VALQFVIIVKNGIEYIYLFKRGKVIIELKPDIAPHLVELGKDGRQIQIGILKTGHQQGSPEQFGVFRLTPFQNILLQLVEMYPVNEQFYTFLHGLIMGYFPQLLQPWYDFLTVLKQFGGHGIINLKVGIVNQSQ
jgi:hypothetical protein